MNFDGSDVEQLTHPDQDVDDDHPTWSPDGTRLVFTRDFVSDRHLFLINADGTGLTQLTDGNYLGPGEWDPDWSPDGTRIAFVSSASGFTPDVYAIRVDGTGLTRLTFTNGFSDNEGSPVWSPDGTKISYHKYNVVGSAGDIWIMNSDGSGQTNLTPAQRTNDRDPAWSPDGTQVALAGGSRIYVMDLDGSDLTKLTDGIGGSPSWQGVPCTISGTPGNDVLLGTAGDDIICGLGGDDLISGVEGNDTLLGGAGRDVVLGEGGFDLLVGEAGSDRLGGGSGDDTLISLDLVSGNDRLDGGSGTDQCDQDAGDLVRSCP